MLLQATEVLQGLRRALGLSGALRGNTGHLAASPPLGASNGAKRRPTSLGSGTAATGFVPARQPRGAPSPSCADWRRSRRRYAGQELGQVPPPTVPAITYFL